MGACRPDARCVANILGILCPLDHHVPFSLASCDECNFHSAYFYQLQIRSADEPMTICAFGHPPRVLIPVTPINVCLNAALLKFTGKLFSKVVDIRS